ncbi:MAG: HAD-IA family hydrolase [Rubrimonas sp.]
MKAVIFDLDGTLADTAPDLIGATNAIAAAEGWPLLDPVADRAVAGRGGRALIGRAMLGAGLTDPDRVAALIPEFLRLYEARIADETRLFPGASECLDTLAAQGWALGICTNKPARLANILLDRLGVADRFAAVLGADSLPVRKPDPLHFLETARRIGADTARSVLVGDTITDRLTARAAGVPCILCRFGYAVEPLSELAAEAEIDCLSEAPAAAARLAA